MVNSWDKFCLLLWKNCLIQRRRWVQTAAEVIAPLVFSFFLILIRKQVDIDDINGSMGFESFRPDYLPPQNLKIPLDEQGLEVLNENGDRNGNETRGYNHWLCDYVLHDILPQQVAVKEEDPEENEVLLNKLLKIDVLLKELEKNGVTLDDLKTDKALIKELVNNGVAMADLSNNDDLINEIEQNSTLNRGRYIDVDKWVVLYTPEADLLKQFMQKVSKDKFVACPVKNDRQLEYQFTRKLRNGKLTKSLVLAGVVFPSDLENLFAFPSSLNVILRFPGDLRFTSSEEESTWNTQLLYATYEKQGPRNPQEQQGGPPGYYKEGFLFLQSAISLAFMKQISNVSIPDFDINLERFPYPPYKIDSLLPSMKDYAPITILLSFVFSAISLVRTITAEKESRIKEAMRMMGIPSWIHWCAWFFKYLMFFSISIVIITLMWSLPIAGTGPHILPASHWTCLLVFLFLYVMASITFCFAVSSFFSRSNIAAVSTGLIWYFSFVPFDFIKKGYQARTMAAKMVACLMPNTAMAVGFQFIIASESKGSGLQWSNIWTPSNYGETMTMGQIMVMLIFDLAFYMAIAIYVENIYPGEYGVPRPWYFPFTRDYWFGDNVVVEDQLDIPNTLSNSVVEPGPKNYVEGVQIRDLRKVYPNNKVAVDCLNLTLYEDQITVLLGHNGAGKTTTMSILTGLYTPTAGTALIVGHDIRKDMDSARKFIGLCPQFNILFDELTVVEHLKFFGKMKGLTGCKLLWETDKFLRMLNFNNKANTRSSALSGGMQRKLATGIALCGGSKVVFLDEPTSGMDPEARRDLWDLLQAEKNGRTILLSTHFMDEADIIGDRIAIMSEGLLQCVGSSFFLKKKYGGGYHLTMVKGDDCVPSLITSRLSKHMPGIQPSSDIGSELSYHLEDKYLPKFESIFAELESNKAVLGITGYGVSLTTMEEVFTKAIAESKVEKNNETVEATDCSENITHSFKSPELPGDAEGKTPHLKWHLVIVYQTLAMWYKHVLSSYRSFVFYLIIVMLIIINLFLAVNAAKSFADVDDLPPLRFTLKDYEGATVAIAKTGSAPTRLVDAYKDLVSEDTIDVNYLHPHFRRVKPYISAADMEFDSEKYLLGTTFENYKVTAMFNNEPYHSSSLALSYVYNAILRAYIGKGSSIDVVNHPLPYDPETKDRLYRLQSEDPGYMMAYHVGFSFASVFAYFAVFHIRERICKAKLLQFTSGVNVNTFWINAYIWDAIAGVGPVTAVIFFYACWHEDGFSSNEELTRQFVVMLSSIVASLPLTYLVCLKIGDPSTGFALMVMISLLTGVVPYIAVTILENPALHKESFAQLLDTIFTVFPAYSLTYSLKCINQNYKTLQGCRFAQYICDIQPNKCCRNSTLCPDGKCLPWTDNYFDYKRPGVGWNMWMFFIVAVVLFIFLLLVEHGLFGILRYEYKRRRKVIAEVNSLPDDEDVQFEQQKINQITDEETRRKYNLLLQNVTKYYGKFRAVNNLNLGVKKGECFGLLGVNGAGKTTTFRMLTGDAKMSSGDAYIQGLSLRKEMKRVRQLIGYCPQFDGILEDLTGRETLRLFCLIRCIPFHDIKYISELLAEELLFSRYIDRKVKEYSGGNKRKLSTALALIGDPPVIYLDEPTTGMDPVAKRHLWNVISKRRASGKTIILTSHSMEECEALCTRLAIMVNGEFKCLGSIQHLKNKFAKGYTLIIKVRRYNSVKLENSRHLSLRRRESSDIKMDSESIKKFVEESFEGAILREEFQGLLTYELPRTGVTWARMFGIMVGAHARLNIEDYSIGQTSLEQVFLSFTRQQETKHQDAADS